MNEALSKLVTDLFMRSKGSEALQPKIDRLRDEIKKTFETGEAISGKFRGLLESFREIIPDEKQRYHAAIKALSTTSKLSQQEIIKAINDQIEELKILEKSLLPALPSWRDELKTMEARSREIKAEIATLRDTIARLDVEEDGIRKGMATREKDVELAEKAVRELFTSLGADITTIKKKIEEFTAESAPLQPAPQKAASKSETPVAKKSSVEKKGESEKKTGTEENVEIQMPPAPVDSEFQKKCPMCGGRFNYHANEKLWMCYTCAYEESEKDGAQGKSGEVNFGGSAPEPEPASAPASPASEQAPKSKTCPVCRKTMYWYPDEKAWRCPSCYYERKI